MVETADLSTLTKDELRAEAEDLGLDVASTDTKADLIAKIRAAEGDAEAQAQEAPNKGPFPVVVDNFTRRSDDDALYGSFVDVVSGEHAGVWGAYRQDLEWDKNDGYPTKVLVQSRDDNAELLVVDYADIRPSDRNGGR